MSSVPPFRDRLAAPRSLVATLAVSLLPLLGACTTDMAAPPTLTVIDPPVEPGQPVAFARGATAPQPVLVYQPPERINPPDGPAILPPPVDHGDRQQTLVEARPTRILVGRGAVGQQQLINAIEDAGGGRYDAVHIEIKGDDKAAARSAVRIAQRVGIDPSKIKYKSEPVGRGMVEVAVLRFVAIPPTCASQAIVGPSVEYNDFDVSLGCSTRNNLAQMVNDPADLLMNNARLPADGARAEAAVARYRSPVTDSRGSTTNAGSGSTPIDTAGIGFAAPGGTFLGAGGPISR